MEMKKMEKKEDGKMERCNTRLTALYKSMWYLESKNVQYGK
jgi:hypothetical protein